MSSSVQRFRHQSRTPTSPVNLVQLHRAYRHADHQVVHLCSALRGILDLEHTAAGTPSISTTTIYRRQRYKKTTVVENDGYKMTDQISTHENRVRTFIFQILQFQQPSVSCLAAVGTEWAGYI